MKQTAYQTACELLAQNRLSIPIEDAITLVRASRTLHRWAELECGDGNDYASWSIERDEKTSKPYFVTYPHAGKSRRRPIADRENGALKRIRATCERHGLSFFHQTDPRGLSLYVSKEALTDSNYNRGVAIG